MIPAHLLDTNILVRAVEPNSEQYSTATMAVEYLLANGAECFISTQILVEFWAVATRPRVANGLGWEPSQTGEEIARIRRQFPLLPDIPAILDSWLAIVATGYFPGKRAHDARIVAVMHTYKVSHILTFNVDDFSHAPGITVVSPDSIAIGSIPPKT